jgi:hypothetical protein
MKLITAYELADRSESELSALFHCATVVLTRSAPLSSERRVALATLENIQLARAQLALQL